MPKPLTPLFTQNDIDASNTVLCADIGGTKALMALARIVDGRPQWLLKRRYACADFTHFEDLLEKFASEAAPLGTPTHACLAVAGPISADGKHAHITNLPWEVNAESSSVLLNIPNLHLTNDFATAAYGVSVLDDDGCMILQKGCPQMESPRLVIGAGTGLGMAVLLHQKHGWQVLAGEGGHIGYSPQDETGIRIHAALLKKHGRVTWERLVSGNGLAAIHHILTGETRTPAQITNEALISSAAMSEDEEITCPALRTIEVFLKAYGEFAGDTALALLPRAGVFLAGGVIGKMLPLLSRGTLVKAFNARLEHLSQADELPVYAVSDDELGLIGAALMAADEI